MKPDEQPNQQEPVNGSVALRAAAVAAAAGIAARTATAQTTGHVGDDECVLVQFYLRGGADGLTLCVPLDEPNYHLHRDKTRVYHPDDTSAPASKKATLIEAPVLDNLGGIVRTGFGLPPKFVGMKQHYDAGKLCFVHAVGSLDPTRSHFAQQAYTELGEVTATPNPDGNGWLGRYLDDTPARGDGSLRALAFGTVKITSYNGGNGVTPSADPSQFDYPIGAPVKDSLQALYSAVPNPVQSSLENDLGAINKLQNVTWSNVTGYSVLNTQFKYAYDVIRDVPDIEVITIDYDNVNGKRWDTHNDQGVFNNGTMANLMDDLSDSITEFLADIATVTGKKAIVLIYTEFGRTLHENDGEGTDHGRGGVAMLLGDDVNGQQVYTDGWPGLDDAALDPPTTGDLAVTIDIRDIQAEAISKCLGGRVWKIFPDDDYTFHDHGLISVL
jgi:uncharacterized protein (DUF1501 family)